MKLHLVAAKLKSVPEGLRGSFTFFADWAQVSMAKEQMSRKLRESREKMLMLQSQVSDELRDFQGWIKKLDTNRPASDEEETDTDEFVPIQEPRRHAHEVEVSNGLGGCFQIVRFNVASCMQTPANIRCADCRVKPHPRSQCAVCQSLNLSDATLLP